MSEFYIKTESLISASATLNSVSKEINSIADDAEKIINKVANNIITKAAYSIKGKIIAGNINASAKDINNLSNGIERIIAIYSRFEAQVANRGYDLSDVEAYVKDPKNYMGFLKYDIYIKRFMGSRNDLWDAFRTGFGNLIDLSYYTSTYNESIIYSSLGGVLAVLCETEEIDLSQFEITDDILSYFKGGAKTQKILKPELLEKNPFFKEFFAKGGTYDDISALSDVIDWTQFSLEEIDFIIRDYSENLLYLSTMEKCMKDAGVNDKEVYSAIKWLKTDYTNKYTKVIHDLGEKGVTDAAKKAVNSFTGDLFSVATFSNTLINDFTGNGDFSDNMSTLLGIQLYSNSLHKAYDAKCEIIKSGNYTQADLEECARLHNICRETSIQEYELMYELTNDESIKQDIQSELVALQGEPKFEIH